MTNFSIVKITIVVIFVAVGISAFVALSEYNKPPSETISLEIPESEISTPTLNPPKSNITKIGSTQEEYEFNLENSNNAKLMPQNPINKITTSGNIFGFTADNGLHGGMTTISLVNPEEKLSIRFTSKFSGELTKAKVYLESLKDIKIKIGVQEDVDGHPSGEWMGEYPGFVETIGDLKHRSHDTINLVNDISLKENKVYHIVIEFADETINGEIMMFSYQENRHSTSFNHEDPDEIWPDNAIDILYFDGNGWNSKNKWPVYVIEYTSGISDGQPYSLMAPWVIKKSSMVGQTVTPFSNYNIQEIAFVVSRDGTPTDNLYYTIYDEKNTKLETGVFATPTELSSKESWHQVKLESEINLESGNIYRIILSSPNADLKNSYKIYGHEFMLDRSLGYGSVKHYLTKSTDGVQWSKWYDADAAFKLITK